MSIAGRNGALVNELCEMSSDAAIAIAMRDMNTAKSPRYTDEILLLLEELE